MPTTKLGTSPPSSRHGQVCGACGVQGQRHRGRVIIGHVAKFQWNKDGHCELSEQVGDQRYDLDTATRWTPVKPRSQGERGFFMAVILPRSPMHSFRSARSPLSFGQSHGLPAIGCRLLLGPRREQRPRIQVRRLVHRESSSLPERRPATKDGKLVQARQFRT